jgi:transcription-repair coupling factor (superfamily II helicase)
MTATLPHVAAAERMRQLPRELTAHAGFGDVLAALASGRPASLDGVWGSACALVAAAVHRSPHAPREAIISRSEMPTQGRTTLVLCPTQRAADDLAADLAIFTATEATVFPAWEGEPDERLVHDETYGDRLRVLKEFSGFRVQDSGGNERSEIGGQSSDDRITSQSAIRKLHLP